MSWRVSEGGDSANTGHDLGRITDKGYQFLERIEVPAGRVYHDIGSFGRGGLRGPEIPLLFRDEIEGVGENELSCLVQRASYVVGVGVGDDNRVDLGRLDARSPQTLGQQAGD